MKRISPHLSRAPVETVQPELARFYGRLLALLRRPVVREGDWKLLECQPAWEGNWTSDCFVAFAWQNADGERVIVAVNYADHQSQCYLRLPFDDLTEHDWRMRDLLSDSEYTRRGADLSAKGLYLDESPWRASVYVMLDAAQIETSGAATQRASEQAQSVQTTEAVVVTT